MQSCQMFYPLFEEMPAVPRCLRRHIPFECLPSTIAHSFNYSGEVADPEGFAISWSGLVRGGHCFRSDGSSDTSPDFDPRRFPRRLGDILGASAAVLHVVPECDLRRVPEPLRGDLDHAHVLAALRFES